MADKKARDRDARLLMTFLLFIFLAVPVTSSLLESPSKKSSSLQNQISFQGTRQPASVLESQSETTQELSSASTFQFDCNKPAWDLSGGQVRWTGKWCSGQEWKSLEVINETNGFTASVIAMKDLKFTTDFVDLAEGENEFSFKATLAGGEVVEKTIKVFRRSPASTPEKSL